jgi:hypothetical protein
MDMDKDLGIVGEDGWDACGVVFGGTTDLYNNVIHDTCKFDV